jgi:hypothetical protein
VAAVGAQGGVIPRNLVIHLYKSLFLSMQLCQKGLLP